MIIYREIDEREALDIVRRAGMKPVRAVMGEPAHGVTVYMEEYPKWTKETADAKLLQQGGMAILWGNVPPQVWIKGIEIEEAS
jgi:hypothetical protein